VHEGLYDYPGDQEVSAPVSDSTPSKLAKRRQPSEPSETINWGEIALSKIKTLQWWDWLAIGGGVAITGLLLVQWQPAPPTQTLSQKPAITYDDGARQKIQEGEIDSLQNNLTGFYKEQRQIAVIGIAQTFRSIAVSRAQQPTSGCDSELSCLNNFWASRKADYERLITQSKSIGGNSPQELFNPIFKADQANAKAEGLRLAIALATPASNRAEFQSTLIEEYPLLASGKKLQLKPAVARQLLTQIESANLDQQSTDPEEQAKTQFLLEKEKELQAQPKPKPVTKPKPQDKKQPAKKVK
jgi:hypothetical protein